MKVNVEKLFSQFEFVLGLDFDKVCRRKSDWHKVVAMESKVNQKLLY